MTSLNVFNFFIREGNCVIILIYAKRAKIISRYTIPNISFFFSSNAFHALSYLSEQMFVRDVRVQY